MPEGTWRATNGLRAVGGSHAWHVAVPLLHHVTWWYTYLACYVHLAEAKKSVGRFNQSPQRSYKIAHLMR